MTASDVLRAAAALMDDPGQQTYTDDVLLPYLLRTYGILERKLKNVGSRKLRTTSEDIQVTGQVLDITNRTDGLLDDLLSPIDLYRKEDVGGYIKLINFAEYQTQIAEAFDIIDNLYLDDRIYWQWEKGRFRFSKDINETLRVVYFSTLRPAGETFSPSSPVQFVEFDIYLSLKTASFGAYFLMENNIKGAILEKQADDAWDDIDADEVKERQTEGVRRRPFKGRRRRHISGR